MTFDEVDRFIKKGDVVALRRALDQGVSPNLAHRFSCTLLMSAALGGNTRVGRLLIERGASVDHANNRGETALWHAAHMGQTSFVELLLEHGASPECCPYAASLESWLDSASGLPKSRIIAIMRLINTVRNQKEPRDKSNIASL